MIPNWTDERVDLLKALYADGLSHGQIAAELGGVTRNAVIGKCTRLGLTGRPQSPKRVGRNRKGGANVVQLKRSRPANPIRSMLFQYEPIEEVTDQDIPLEQRKTLFQLKDDTCRWPCGDPGDPSFFFCGGTTLAPGEVYCACHWRRGHSRRPERNPEDSPLRQRAAKRAAEAAIRNNAAA